LPETELIPMLEQLLSLAPTRSQQSRLAKHHLARLIVADQPWRAARLATELLADANDLETTDTNWAVLGMAQTVMGNYRSARRAHQNALALAPGAPSHLHNLGHLLDMAFNRPGEALRYLRAAYDGVPDEPEVASSYAHALARTGRIAQARQILSLALGSAEDASALIARWLGQSDSSSNRAPRARADEDAELEAAQA
jgi:Flp pilus assembly protein TadD